MPILKAPALQPGDTIMLITPASPVSQERVDGDVAALEARGYRVIVAPNVTSRFGYLAGTDQERVDSINEAIRNPEVRAVFSLVGGFGTTRLIDKIDYEALRNDPKIFIGFSDITGLHLAIFSQTGLITFHSPSSPGVLASQEDQLTVTLDNFWRAIEGLQYPDDGTEGYTPTLEGAQTPLRALAPGVATGRMVGGNLSLIAATMGTPFQIQTEGNILFLEDVNEAPFRVDRMLSTMRLAGLFDNMAGVVLGRFTRFDEEAAREGFSMNEVLEFYFADLGIPVIADFPVGHTPDNMTIPHGVMAEINADELTLRFIENPVLLDR